jgi:molecular chaperone IbpA
MRSLNITSSNFEELFRDLNRVAIGFEPTIRKLQDVQTSFAPSATNYPPYDLELVSEDQYRLTLAVAGFSLSDLDIETYDNQLVITGEIKDKQEDRTFLYRSIAGRAFKRMFHLADHVRIENAKLDQGLLTIDLIREVPESKKVRKIEISDAKTINLDHEIT